MSEDRSGRRRRQEAGPGWIATAAGALLLMLVGFALGLVAGAAFEEPGLVTEHLRGRTTRVALPLASEPEQGEAVSPGAPESRTLRQEALGQGAPSRPFGAPLREPPESAPSATGGEPRVSAPPSPTPETAGFTIQVGAFAEREAADTLHGRLREAELPVRVQVEEQARAPFKVRVGPYATREQAEKVAARLKKQWRLPTWVFEGAREDQSL